MPAHGDSVSNRGDHDPRGARAITLRQICAGSEGDAVRDRRAARIRAAAAAVSAAALLAGCATVIDGHASVANAPNAHIAVKGDNGGAFDTSVKNALSDIIGFWKAEFPKVSGGKPLNALKGGLYSVNGMRVAQTGHVKGPAKGEGCIGRDPGFIVDNGAYCILDDSIVWDRSPTHLFARLAQKYGPLMVALIFAHEFGHAISYRLGVFNKHLRTIDTESQADCAAGAWAASALKGQDPHFRDTTPQKLDDALEGFLDGRDATPGTPADVSHGNGFDRLSAVADGIDKGATYCYSSRYFKSRTFTERPFSSEQDYAAGGNTPLVGVLAPSASNEFVKDLNRYWSRAAKTAGKKFAPVKIAQATHPKCGATPSSEFGYCPGDNTVYYNQSFAKDAYYSLPAVQGNQVTGSVRLLNNQPGDFALGVLFSMGWGMAVRHQLFNSALDNRDALISAICYSGSYAKDINVAQATHGQLITLSPADLDEATSAMLNRDIQARGFGARGSTGLDRIQAFVKGYHRGLSSC
jgi:predicted metalloprotease